MLSKAAFKTVTDEYICEDRYPKLPPLNNLNTYVNTSNANRTNYKELNIPYTEFTKIFEIVCTQLCTFQVTSCAKSVKLLV